MIIRRISAALALSLIVLLANLGGAYAASAKKAQPTCEQSIISVNYRASLLKTYKASEDKKYKASRNLWAKRIAYAGQWLPADATKTRTSLYAYDDLHKATNSEIDKQVAAFTPLLTHPLSCSDGDKAKLNQKLAEIKGIKNKKSVSGDALIHVYQVKEDKYQTKDFQKSTDSLMKNLHKYKVKHPAPSNKPLTVTTI